MDATRTPRLGNVQPTLSSRFAAPRASLAERSFREPRSRQDLGLSAGSSGPRRRSVLIVLLAALVAPANGSAGELKARAATVVGPPTPAVAGATQRIRAEEAAVRAVNTLRPDGDRLVLRQPHDRVEFAAEGVRFEPRRGPAWSWSLRAVEAGGTALPGVRLAGVGPRADGFTARYERGALVEEYVAHADGIEQRFVLGAPPAAAGALVLVGEVASAGSFETLARGWRWRNDRGAVRLGEVFAYDATGAALPATLEVTATGTRIVLDGAALAAARYPVTVDPEIGANDFRISDMGGTGDANYDAFEPAVAYNATDNEYLVVWAGDDDVGGLVDGEYEIFGQRLDAATGAEVGSNDLRISDMGGTGDVTYGALLTAVAYNATDNEYLVVWRGSDNVGGLVTGETEVFGQRLDGATGAEVGSNDFRISDMGGTGDANYDIYSVDVAYDAADNEYLVVWMGDDDTGGLVDNEYEIFGQRLDAATGAEVGGNDFRISDMGGTGNANYEAESAAVAYNAIDNEYLVVWKGDDNVGGLVDNEYEIYGQRINAATGTALGSDDFRISDMGGTGDTGYRAGEPVVAYNAADNEYLVVWMGDDNVGGLVDNEYEIFGQRIDAATGAEVGSNDFRISAMGGTGNAIYDAYDPAVAYNAAHNGFVVVWRGDHDGGGLSDNELEVFGELLGADGVTIGPSDVRLSDMGGTGDNPFGVASPAVAHGSNPDELLVVWKGDDDVDGLVDEESEIFGQRLTGDPTLLFLDGFESGGTSAWSATVP